MHPVMIVGGGIGGLSAALALRRVGIGSLVLEKSPGPNEIGAGITLWSNAVLCLRALQLDQPVIAAGTTVVAGELRDWRGRVLVRTPVEVVSREFGVPSVAIHRGTLARILTEDLDPNAVVYGAECEAIRQHDSHVEVRCADGRSFFGSLLVGADGLRSQVLTELFGAQPLRYAGYTCFRGVADLPASKMAAGYAFESWAAQRRFGAIRLNDQRAYWFANVTQPAGWSPSVASEWLAAEFAQWHDPIPALIANSDPTKLLQHDIFDRPPRADRLGQGGVTLVGDACHPMTPNLGQGGCQALEDAIVLATSLARHGITKVALRNYEAERFPRTASLVRQSRRQGWISHRPTRWECAIRDWCTWLVPAGLMTSVFRRIVTIPDPKLAVPADRPN